MTIFWLFLVVEVQNQMKIPWNLGTIKLHFWIQFQPYPKIWGAQKWPKMAKNSLFRGIFESLKGKNCHKQQGTDWHGKITFINNVLALSKNSRYPKLAKNRPKSQFLGYFESLKGKKCHRWQETVWHNRIIHIWSILVLFQTSRYPKLANNSLKKPSFGYF